MGTAADAHGMDVLHDLGNVKQNAYVDSHAQNLAGKVFFINGGSLMGTIEHHCQWQFPTMSTRLPLTKQVFREQEQT